MSCSKKQLLATQRRTTSRIPSPPWQAG
jgi:hypothetical protein